MSKRTIPQSNAAGALSVSDSCITVGSIVERDGSFFSFDVDGILIGEFESQIEAMRSIKPEHKKSRL